MSKKNSKTTKKTTKAKKPAKGDVPFACDHVLHSPEHIQSILKGFR